MIVEAEKVHAPDLENPDVAQGLVERLRALEQLLVT